MPTSEPPTCAGCGAPLASLVCRQCGAYSGQVGDPALERRGLDEYRRALREMDEPARVRLLSTGFLPSSPEALIEAGLHCVPLIDEAWTDKEANQAAVRRLEAIAVKLRVYSADERAVRAGREFADRVDSFRRADRAVQLGGLAAFFTLLAALVLIGGWLVRALR